LKQKYYFCFKCFAFFVSVSSFFCQVFIFVSIFVSILLE
jgi:hypothetical protein